MKKIDLLGRRFGRWLVAEPSDQKTAENQILWWCLCDCGEKKLIRGGSLTTGNSLSCGCLKIEQFKERFTKHGLTGSPTYLSWQSMVKRCYKPTDTSYFKYGAKGISVCDRWRYSFENFLQDMGMRPSRGHTLDRFPNNAGNYEPGNVRWATGKEQGANRKDNNWIEYEGRRMILQDWVRELKTSHGNFIRMSKSKGVTETIKFYSNRNAA